MSLQALQSSTVRALALPQHLPPPRSPSSTQQAPSLLRFAPEPS